MPNPPQSTPENHESGPSCRDVHRFADHAAAQDSLDGTVHVEVNDAGSSTTTPAVRAPALSDDSGRGLWLVDTLADEWGFHRDENRGSVWFRLTGSLQDR